MTKIYKYKGSKALFNRWQNLHWRVQGLGAITQNPEMEITEDLYLEWLERVNSVKEELDMLVAFSKTYVESGEVIENG